MLRRYLAGDGRLEPTTDGWRLEVNPATGYNDAQLDDTRGRARGDFLHRPPVRLTVEARASSASPPGTLGFGFWNDPFPSWAGEAGAGRRLPASPQALWFFHAAPPSELPFSPGGPASGWTAAVLRGPPVPGPVIAAIGAAGLAGIAIPRLRRPLLRQYWRWFSGEQSARLTGLDAWRAYEIDWRDDAVQFRVDGLPVLDSSLSPPGPLGLVIWIDNQWATLSATAGLRFGVLPSSSGAWLELRSPRLNDRPLQLGS
jgi:hypothetical protein